MIFFVVMGIALWTFVMLQMDSRLEEMEDRINKLEAKLNVTLSDITIEYVKKYGTTTIK